MLTGAAAGADPYATSVVKCDTLPWAELQPGFEIKLLRVGEGSGTYTVATRLAPGVYVPTHRHHGPVHAWTVSGRWRYREYDWVAQAGDYVFEPTNSTHTLEIPVDCGEPAVVVFVISGAQDYLDEAGNVLWTQDAEFVRALYENTLAAQGVPFPPDVLP